jgi:hypothetical protein
MRVLRRLWLPALIVIGLGLIVGAGFLGNTGNQEPLGGQPALEAIIPRDGAQILEQDGVGADLQVGWAGVLTINGVDIPANQLEQDNGLNQLIFKPGSGKVLTRLQPDRNCAKIVFWRLQDGRAADSPSRTWCFNVL